MQHTETICGKSATRRLMAAFFAAIVSDAQITRVFFLLKKSMSPKAHKNPYKIAISFLSIALSLPFLSCYPLDRTPKTDINPDLILASEPYSIGGNFTLTDQNGNDFTLSSQNRPHLLFFGYASCPDACPQTLARLASAYTILGEDAKNLTTLFISVDPKRDTPETLKTYLSHFDVPTIGLTGSQDSINAIVKRYAAHFEISDQESAGGYLIDHSLYTYVLDQNGDLRFFFRPSHTAEEIATVVRQLGK